MGRKYEGQGNDDQCQQKQSATDNKKQRRKKTVYDKNERRKPRVRRPI